MIFLSHYFTDVRTAYNTARAEYTRLNDKLESLDMELHRAMTGRELTAQGKAQAKKRIDAEKAQVAAELAQVVRTAKAAFKDNQEAVRRKFSRLYDIDPDKIDSNAVSLLKAGVLRDDEFPAFADRYQNNPTMTRLIAKAVRERSEANGSKDLNRLAIRLDEAVTPAAYEGIDTMVMWCERGLGDRRYIADGVNAVFENHVEEIVDKYGCINVGD